MEDGAFAVFFRPHHGGFDSSRVPTPGNLPSKAKKNANARGSARGGGGAGRRWNWLMHQLHLNTQTKRSVTTVVHTSIHENQISWRRVNFITWKFGLYSTTNCRHNQRQPSRMNHLSYFCREPKTIIPAENNNDRRKGVYNKELSQFWILWTSQYLFIQVNNELQLSGNSRDWRFLSFDRQMSLAIATWQSTFSVSLTFITNNDNYKIRQHG